MNTKQWYQSWTVWFNIVMLAITTVNELAKIVPISADVMAYVALIGNFLLRFKTVSGISSEPSSLER